MSRIAFYNKCIDKTISLKVDNDTLPLVVHREGLATINGKSLCRTVNLYVLWQKVIDIKQTLQLPYQLLFRLRYGNGGCQDKKNQDNRPLHRSIDLICCSMPAASYPHKA